jgi:hypothetical protein
MKNNFKKIKIYYLTIITLSSTPARFFRKGTHGIVGLAVQTQFLTIVTSNINKLLLGKSPSADCPQQYIYECV